MPIITRKGEYAVLILLELASRPPRSQITTRQIIENQGLPPKLAPQLVAALGKKGWLATASGLHGGVSLMADPETIAVGQVLEAVEGPLRPSPCRTGGQPCFRVGACALGKLWDRTHRLVTDTLFGTTIGQLVRAQHLLDVAFGSQGSPSYGVERALAESATAVDRGLAARVRGRRSVAHRAARRHEGDKWPIDEARRRRK